MPTDDDVLNPIFCDGTRAGEAFSPFDTPGPDPFFFDEDDDDTVYELTPKGLRTVGESIIEEYNDEFTEFEAEWDAKLDEAADQRWETIQRWYDERRIAREQVVELSKIVTLFVEQFETIAAYPDRSTELAQEALRQVVKVEDAD